MTRIVKTILADGTLRVYEYPSYRHPSAASRPARDPDHLYVIRSNSGMVKIGRSGDPKSRLAALQTSSADGMVLVKVLRGRGHEETAVHAALKEWRQQGEWFRDTQDFREKVRELLGVIITFRQGAAPALGAWTRAQTTARIRAVCDEIRGRPANTDELAAYEAQDRFDDGDGTLEELNALRVKAGWPPWSK